MAQPLALSKILSKVESCLFAERIADDSRESAWFADGDSFITTIEPLVCKVHSDSTVSSVRTDDVLHPFLLRALRCEVRLGQTAECLVDWAEVHGQINRSNRSRFRGPGSGN